MEGKTRGLEAPGASVSNVLVKYEPSSPVAPPPSQEKGHFKTIAKSGPGKPLEDFYLLGLLPGLPVPTLPSSDPACSVQLQINGGQLPGPQRPPDGRSPVSPRPHPLPAPMARHGSRGQPGRPGSHSGSHRRNVPLRPTARLLQKEIREDDQESRRG